MAFFSHLETNIAKDINQSLTLQDALNILQLWQKAFQYKPHATSTQKNSQKTNKQKPPVEQTNKHQQQQKKNHKEVYLVTSGHLCEKVEKYFLVCTHISFLYLYQCLWLHDEVLDITVGADWDVKQLVLRTQSLLCTFLWQLLWILWSME